MKSHPSFTYVEHFEKEIGLYLGIVSLMCYN
jgi:hypothetical protein